MSLATLACMIVFTLTAFAQQQQEPLRHVEPYQLRVAGGHEARTSLGVSVDFGTEGTANTSGTVGEAKTSGTGAANSSPALTLWTYQTTAAQNKKSYTGKIVGNSPTSGSTSVPAVLVPVVLKITEGGTTYTFDPTATDTSCLGSGNTAMSLTSASPLFSTAATFTINGVSIGPTQYSDAIVRAEFWTSGGSTSGNHLLLSPVSTGATLTISVNAGTGGNSTAEVYSASGQCGNGLLGVVNINTIDAAVQGYIRAHSLNATEFPFFVLYNAAMSIGSANNINNCCAIGYHNALGNPGQTYGVTDFEGRDQTLFPGVADVAAASHEVNEWVNDPSGTNPTPAWGNIGQVSGCESEFEVGDPLTGTLMPTGSFSIPGSFTYHLQELAFYSWFYGGTSLGAGGKYSSAGTFKGAAKLCPPGGTN
jgi:hypothetical protein